MDEKEIKLVLGDGVSIQLVVPQYVNVTRSFSWKLVPENYGIEGHRYAPLDFFASYGDSIPKEEATPEKIAEVSQQLYDMAKHDVEEAISAKLKELTVPKSDGMTTDDLDKVAPFMMMIAGGSTVEEVSEKIVAAKDTMSEKQLDFLRNLIKAKYNK